MRFRTSGTNWEGRRWVLASGLMVLARQIDEFDSKSHPADGTVASRAHDQNSPSSDHRPKPYSGTGVVRAIDFGENTEDDAFNILESIRLSRDKRVKYCIHERRMFSSYASGGVAPFTWRAYSGPAPHDTHGHCSTLEQYDTETYPWMIGKDMAKGPNGEPNWDKVADWAKQAWSEAWAAGILSDTSDPKDVVEMEQLMVTFKRAKIF
jgi:hypothetical protein